MSLLALAGTNSATGGYNIDNSLKVESDNSERLSLTLGTPTSAKTMTFSWWFKRTELGRQWLFTTTQSGASGFETFRIYLEPDDQLSIQDYDATNNYSRVTNRMFRDTSAWYHIVIAIDTTQATASNRIKVYVNGVQETSFGTDSPPAQNHDIDVGSGKVLSIGAWDQDGVGYFYEMENYIAEAHFIDGQQLEPTDFGEYDEDSGIWKPKAYTGSYGTNGFFLDFESSGSLGADSSGNGNDFTLTNITAADQATDTPTNNFAIGNAIVYFSNPTMATFNAITEGATKITKGADGWETLSSTIGVTRGKWYMEMQNIVMPESAMMSVFPADIEFLYQGGQINNYAGKVSGDGGISYYSYSGYSFYNATNTSYGVSWANETNTMAIALDMDNGKVYFARANVWQNSGDPTSGATGTGAINLIEPSEPHMMGYSIYANTTSGAVNFGGYTVSSISSAASDAKGYGTFEYAPPSGYYAICTKNLEEFG
jgi:hypothetical protein